MEQLISSVLKELALIGRSVPKAIKGDLLFPQPLLYSVEQLLLTIRGLHSLIRELYKKLFALSDMIRHQHQIIVSQNNLLIQKDKEIERLKERLQS